MVAIIRACLHAVVDHERSRRDGVRKKDSPSEVVRPRTTEFDRIRWGINERLRCPVAPRRGSCAAVPNTQFCSQGSPATVSRWSIFRVQLRQNPPPQNRSRPNRPVSFDHLSQDRRGDVPGAAQDQRSWRRLASIGHRSVGRGPSRLSRRQRQSSCTGRRSWRAIRRRAPTI